MKKVLFITNIPAPYRIDFFNALGRLVDLTVIFEAKTTPKTTFNYNLDSISQFRAIFLSDGDIQEKRFNWNILPLIRRGAYDHVVVTSYGYATEALAILTLKARGIPYEMELDGGIPRNDNPIAHALKAFLIRGAVRYWSTGSRTDRFYESFGVPAERIQRYPFSSISEREIVSRPPDEQERAAAKQRLGIRAERLVLSVGQTIHRKGYDLLIRAASLLPEGVQVVIVGGSPREEWSALMRELNVQNLSFVEFASKETVNDYYTAADVFVLPTREDVWGLVINEAMARGVPVITTDGCVAGCEMIQEGESGYLIPCETYEPLAERITKLLENDAVRECIALAGLDRVRGYTVEAMARTHAAIFEQTK